MPPRWSPAVQGARLLVALAWVVVLGACLVVGERHATFRDLEHAVASGDVREVRVTEGLGERRRGSATVTVHWSAGGLTRTTEVVEARPRHRAPRWDQRGDRVTGVVTGDLPTHLRSLGSDSGVEVEVVEADLPGVESSLLGFRLPGWAGVLALLAGLGTFLLLIGAPEPRGATRWAWFWLMLIAPPVGVTGYLLLAAPRPGRTSPRPPGPGRLTGGWGLVLATLLGTVLDPVITPV